MTQIIPAIDLQDGRCVRLQQGRFDSTQVYRDDPLALAHDYVAQGARQLHLVDLDAAQNAGKNNTAAIRELAASLPIALQVGGGVRTRDDVEALLAAGARRVVIGSLAMTQPELVASWLREFGPEAIVLALDVRVGALPLVSIHGWQTPTDVSLWDALGDYARVGLCHFLCTDIDRDGMQSGPNIALYEDIMMRFATLQLQASGGVRDQPDIDALGAVGVPFAISGRALLEGTLALAEPA